MKWNIKLEDGTVLGFNTDDTTIHDDHVAQKDAGTPYEYGKVTDEEGNETILESPIVEIIDLPEE